MSNERVRNESRGSEAGFGLIQIAVALLLVTTGLLGLVGSIVSSQLLARSAKEVNLANIAMVSAIEEFRFACASDFSGTCHAYLAGKTLAKPAGLSEGVKMRARVINDESQLSPAIDLNGDGVLGEIVNTISDIKVAVLEVEIEWPAETGDRHKLAYVTLIPRSDYEDSQVPPDPNAVPGSSKVDSTATVSSTAVIGESCDLGKDVVVEEYVVIGDDAKISAGVHLLPNTTLGTKVTIKADAVIGAGTVIRDGADIGQRVVLGENCVIGVGAIVPNDVTVPAGTVIPAGTTYGQ